MPTPFPTSEPGSLPARNFIQVPPVIRNVIAEAGRDLAVESYCMGYEIGWDNATRQFIDEQDIPKTVGYILRRQNVDPVVIDYFVNCVRDCFTRPPPGVPFPPPQAPATGPSTVRQHRRWPGG